MTPDTADYDLTLLDDGGRILDTSGRWGNGTEVAEAIPGTPAVRFGILQASGSGGYEASFEMIDPADIRVGDIDITPRPIGTGHGDVSTGTRWTVEAPVENAGPGNGAPVTVVAYVEQGGDYRSLGKQILEIPAGETADVTFAWDATGQVGDAVVHVFAYPPIEVDRRDNAASATGYAIMGGVGTGVDLLNNREQVHASPVHVFAGTDYRAGSVLAYGNVGILPTYASAAAGLQDGTLKGSACVHTLIDSCVMV